VNDPESFAALPAASFATTWPGTARPPHGPGARAQPMLKSSRLDVAFAAIPFGPLSTDPEMKNPSIR
jgi:hypothetical protein